MAETIQSDQRYEVCNRSISKEMWGNQIKKEENWSLGL